MKPVALSLAIASALALSLLTASAEDKKLDASNKGYVTRDDAKSVEGFDRSFQSADANHDGKLTSDEFKKAWTSFTGNPQ